MFRTLYAKLMVLFLSVLMVAMSLLSVLLYQRIRTDKMEARLSELMQQARDVAYLAAQRGPFISLETNYYLMWKTDQIRHEFDAAITILDGSRNPIPIEDEMFESSSETIETTLEDAGSLLGDVFAGKTVSVRSYNLETGNPIFTVGVPYVSNGAVVAAVFIQTSEQSIESSYRDVLIGSFRAMLMTVAIGSIMILVVCQLITRPLRAMAHAADRFAKGDFSQRVYTESRDEVGRLAESFNSMADDLEQLEQTRREFVANVSHELRSPLTSIQGFIDGVLDGTVEEAEREKYLGIVLDETKRLSKLINTLLDLSHIESGQTPIVKSRYDVNEQIARVLVRQESRICEKNLEVDLAFEAETLPVSADHDRIEQVLINLIDNAVKYSDEGGTLRISAQRKHDKAIISIEDDGPGISAEDLPHVFDRFYMADKAHTSGKGTGLGLAIVKSIIDQHGQKITASSEPGKGTKFTFTLEGA